MEESSRPVLIVCTSPTTISHLALARYNADGSPDSSFGIGGEAITTVFGDDSGADAVAVQSDGEILAAGWNNSPNHTVEDDIARFWP